jgi:RNA polymerase sigma factor (sigma-70 family)
MAVARNKVRMEQRRRLRSGKYDIRRERPIDDVYFVGDGSGIHDPGPRPSEVAIVRERWDTMLAQQSPRSRRIVELRLAGRTYQEIGQELGIDERTVRREVERMLQEHGA